MGRWGGGGSWPSSLDPLFPTVVRDMRQVDAVAPAPESVASSRGHNLNCGPVSRTGARRTMVDVPVNDY